MRTRHFLCRSFQVIPSLCLAKNLLGRFSLKTHPSAPPQDHEHLQALGHLQRALGSAQSLDKADWVKVPEDASPEDLDKPLNQESYDTMDTKFFTSHRFTFPAVFKPSPLTDARSYRELLRSAFTARALARVGNL